MQGGTAVLTAAGASCSPYLGSAAGGRLLLPTYHSRAIGQPAMSHTAGSRSPPCRARTRPSVFPGPVLSGKHRSVSPVAPVSRACDLRLARGPGCTEQDLSLCTALVLPPLAQVPGAGSNRGVGEAAGTGAKAASTCGASLPKTTDAVTLFSPLWRLESQIQARLGPLCPHTLVPVCV